MDELILKYPNTWLDHSSKDSLKKLLQLFDTTRIYQIGTQFKSQLVQLLWTKTCSESSDQRQIQLLKNWYVQYGSDFSKWPSIFDPILHDAANRIYRVNEFKEPEYANLFSQLIAAQARIRVPYFSHFSHTAMLYITDYPSEHLEHSAFYLKSLTGRTLLLHGSGVTIPPLSRDIAQIFATNDTAFLFALYPGSDTKSITYLRECIEFMPSRQAQALIHAYPQYIGRCSEKLSLSEYVEVLNATFDPRELWDLSDGTIEVSQFTKTPDHLDYLYKTYPYIIAYQYLYGSPVYHEASTPFMMRLLINDFSSLSMEQWVHIFDSVKADALFESIKDLDPSMYGCWKSSGYTLDAHNRSLIVYQYIVARDNSNTYGIEAIDLD